MRGRLVLVDLSKDRRLVVDCLCLPPEHAGLHARNIASEGQLRSRQHTHRQSGIIRRGEATCSGAEVTRHEPIGDLRGARTYAMEAKVTHLWNSPLGKAPQLTQAYSFLCPRA